MARLRSLIRGLFTFMILALLFTAGCGKKSNSTSVQLQLPQWPSKESMRKTGGVGTLAVADNIQVIIVNITGSGITPAYFFWDRHSANAGSQPPTSIPFTVAKGSARLTQVMIVFEDESADTGMEFYYGDSTMDFTTDPVSVPITVSAIGTSARKDGNIAGRYLYADGTGPTGPVEFRYTPSGKPSMLLTKGHIYNGWFDFFALEDVPFTYILSATKEVIFDKVNLANAAPSASVATARVNVPRYYYSQTFDSNGNPTGARGTNQGRTSIVGFFGPGAGTKPVCFSNTAASLSGAYVSADISNSTLLQWVGNSSNPNGNASIISGGQVTSACPAVADVFSNHLRIDTDRITNRDGMLGFQGPYILSDPGESSSWKRALTATTAGSSSSFSVTLGWKYLPGVTNGSGGIAGSKLFYRSGQLSSTNRADYEGSDGISCADLVSKYNFIEAADIAATTATGSVTLTANQISEASYNAGRFQAALCPYYVNSNNEKLYPSESGVDYYTYAGMNSTGSTMPATKLAAFKALTTLETTANDRATFYQNACYPLTIAGINSQGFTASTTGTLQLNVTSSESDLYTNSDCYSTGSTTITDYNFTGQRTIYWKPSSIGAKTLAISANTLTSTTFFATSVASVTADQLITVAPSQMYRYECRIVEFISTKNNVPAGVPTSTTFTLNTTDWSFSDISYGNCNGGGQTSFTLDPTKTSQQYWVKYIGTGAGVKTMSPTSAFTGVVTKQVDAKEPGAPAKIMISGLPSSPMAEQCYTVKVSITDSTGHAVPASSSIITGSYADVTMGGTNVGYWVSSCGYSPPTPTTTSSESISDGNTFSYGKSVTFVGGSGAITATLNNPASGVTIAPGSFTATLLPASAVNFVIVPPGQTFTAGTGVSGTASTQIEGQAFNVTLVARTNLKNIANGSTGTAAYNGVVTFDAYEPSYLELVTPTVTFVNGIATMSVRFKANSGGTSRSVRLTVVSPSSAPPPLDSSYLNVNYDLEPTHFAIYAMGTFVQNVCQPIYIAFTDANGVSRRLNQSTTLDISTTQTASYYSIGYGSDCSGPTGAFSQSIPAGERGVMLYFRTTNASGLTAITVSAPSSSMVANSLTGLSVGGTAGTATELRIWGATSPQIGVCTPYMYATTDASGNSVAHSSAITYTPTLNGANAVYFTNPSCSYTDPATIVETGASGARAQVIYVKALVGSTSLSSTVSGLTAMSKTLTPLAAAP